MQGAGEPHADSAKPSCPGLSPPWKTRIQPGRSSLRTSTAFSITLTCPPAFQGHREPAESVSTADGHETWDRPAHERPTLDRVASLHSPLWPFGQKAAESK